MYPSISKLLILFALSVTLVSGFRQVYKDGQQSVSYIESYKSRILNSSSCTRPGRICDGCYDVYQCIQNGPNDYFITQLDSCTGGQTCVSSTGLCTSEHNPGCSDTIPGYHFVCHQIGLFPDAFDCQKYHLCLPTDPDSNEVQEISQELTCETDYYYDVKTTMCRNKLPESKYCPDVAPTCNSTGQTAAIKGNPSLYYICLKSATDDVPYPQMFNCPMNYEYNNLTLSCQDPTPTTATDSTGKCRSGGLFYDPTNCFYYYDCTAAGATAIRRVCSSKMHFNPKTRVCEDFTCDDLK